MTEQTLVISGSQLLALGDLLDLPRLLLAADPYRGWLVEEIADDAPRVMQQLQENGWLTIQPDQTPLVAPEIATLVKLMAQPSQTAMLQTSPAGNQPETIAFHGGQEGWLEVVTLSPDLYQLTHLTAIQARKRIPTYLRVDGLTAAPHSKISLLAASLQEARELAAAQGAEVCATYLARQGISKTHAAHLAAALTHPVLSGSLVLVRWEDGQSKPQGSLAWYASDAGMCLILPDEGLPGWVDLLPATSAQVNNRLHALLALIETN